MSAYTSSSAKDDLQRPPACPNIYPYRLSIPGLNQKIKPAELTLIAKTEHFAGLAAMGVDSKSGEDKLRQGPA